MEWALLRILIHNLEPRKSPPKTVDLSQLENETATLLSVVANAGANTPAEAQRAFNLSKAVVGFENMAWKSEQQCAILDLDLAITRLNAIKPMQKPKLLKSLSQCILADEKVTTAEAELFRAIADALDCPMPPLIVNSH